MPDRKQTRADAVRSAVDEAFAAAAGQASSTRERAQDLVGDLTHVAGGMRDLRPVTSGELRELRDQVRALSERVSALERQHST